MTKSDHTSALCSANFHAKEIADHSKVAFWLDDETNKEWHISECKKALTKLIDALESV